MGNTAPKDRFTIALETKGEIGFCEEVLKCVRDPEALKGLEGKDFDYECLVFEGGGVKGCAYGGAVTVLHDLGILNKIKRFAGTSVGAYMALQAALDLSLNDLIIENIIPSFKEFYDESTFKMFTNILRAYGWHSGSSITYKIEAMLYKRFKRKRVTFREFYDETGKELCIVTTDLNSSCVRYCHPKTTPSLDVAEVVRTSMSLPMLYMPTMKSENGLNLYYIDGGLLNNYPLEAFDGWFLSMKPEDKLVERMAEDPSTQFETINNKTIGMVLFSHGEAQMGRAEYLKRMGAEKVLEGRPDSRLSIARAYTKDVLLNQINGQEKTDDAARGIIQFMAEEAKKNGGEEMSLDQFVAAVEKAKKDPVIAEHLMTLFGSKDALDPLDEAFIAADVSKNGTLSLVECLDYLQRRGVYLRYNLQATRPVELPSLTTYLIHIVSLMQTYIGQMKVKSEDYNRTVGIYTDYVGTADFDINYEDKVYLFQQGYRAAVAFFKERAGVTSDATQ